MRTYLRLTTDDLNAISDMLKRSKSRLSPDLRQKWKEAIPNPASCDLDLIGDDDEEEMDD